MLRIPLPEYADGTLALPEVAKATPTDNFALLALQMRPWRSHREQGRQNTDGGEQRAAPSHGFHDKSSFIIHHS